MTQLPGGAWICAAGLLLIAASPPPAPTAVTFPVTSVAFPSELMRSETPVAIVVTLPADILFDFDKADIRPQAATALHETAALIREQSHGTTAIVGYTDALGDNAYNQRLSERRAGAVKTWLVEQEHLAPRGLSTSGRGAREPVAPNRKPDGSDDPDGRQLNRRVVLTLPK
jgi:outer membrane protein OmpA-like peptidoglycan-associated protein